MAGCEGVGDAGPLLGWKSMSAASFMRAEAENGSIELILGVVGVSGLGEEYTFQGLRTGTPSVSRSVLSLTSREFNLADHLIDN